MALAAFLLFEILIFIIIYSAIKARHWYVSIRVNDHVFHNGESPYESHPLVEVII